MCLFMNKKQKKSTIILNSRGLRVSHKLQKYFYVNIHEEKTVSLGYDLYIESGFRWICSL